MERLKQRSWFVAFLLLAMGALIAFTPRETQAANRNEAWMLKTAPKSFDKYSTVPGNESEEYSYKMNEGTYGALQPYGIVARVMSDGEKQFDTVVIASNRKSSFHDPRVCFTAQGWTLLGFHGVEIDVPGRGKVPATIVKMEDPNKRPSIAAFVYQSGGAFFGTSQEMTIHFLVEQLKGATRMEGVFYRFIPRYPNATEAELIDFMRQYFVAAKKSSNGYF